MSNQTSIHKIKVFGNETQKNTQKKVKSDINKNLHMNSWLRVQIDKINNTSDEKSAEISLAIRCQCYRK